VVCWAFHACEPNTRKEKRKHLVRVGVGWKGFLTSIQVRSYVCLNYEKEKKMSHKLWVLELQFLEKFSWLHLKFTNIFILDGQNIVDFVLNSLYLDDIHPCKTLFTHCGLFGVLDYYQRWWSLLSYNTQTHLGPTFVCILGGQTFVTWQQKGGYDLSIGFCGGKKRPKSQYLEETKCWTCHI
jgi:hypothetical protein